VAALWIYAPHLLALLGVWLLAVITPGPDFVVTSRYAVARSRRDGALVGLGVASGVAIWVTLSLAGLGFAMVYLRGPLAILRVLGALYLVFLGAQALWSAARPQLERDGAAMNGRRTDGGDASSEAGSAVMPSSRSPAFQGGDGAHTARRLPSWLIGFLTNIGNAKALAFFTSIFALLLPANPPLWLDAAILVGMVGISAGWFSLVALLFSLAPVARAYRRAQRWIDALTGGIFVALGVELAANQ
jgi:threonine/homoserine/homoserine lactone efflux protein